MKKSFSFARFVKAVILSFISLSSAAQSPNILVLVADDLGIESLSAYGIGTSTAVTPNLDRLAEEGVRFEGFWSQPSCSPTRAAVMTGRYAFRTGVYNALSYQWGVVPDAPTPVIPASANKELFYGRGTIYTDGNPYVTKPPPPKDKLNRGPSPDEIMLPAVLKSLPAGYATAAVGKWHLTDLLNGGLDHPNRSGFDYYSGALFGGPANFSAWRHLENGKLTAASGYIDSRSTEDALRWINQQGDQPWFLWFSFINPHTPVHLPPKELLYSSARDLDPDLTGDNNQPYFFAQIEAMDTLIGRMLDGIPEDVLRNTYVIFLGDNGSSGVSKPPAPSVQGRLKGTVYEGGVNVPFIVKGPDIAGGRIARPLAHVVDLFATIVELAGGKARDMIPTDRELDSVSFAPFLFANNPSARRTWVMTERSRATAFRNVTHKLILRGDNEEFYHLAEDPLEQRPLDIGSLTGAAQVSYQHLKRQATEQVRP